MHGGKMMKRCKRRRASTSRESSVADPCSQPYKRTNHANALILDFWSPALRKNKLLLLKPLTLWHFATAALANLVPLPGHDPRKERGWTSWPISFLAHLEQLSWIQRWKPRVIWHSHTTVDRAPKTDPLWMVTEENLSSLSHCVWAVFVIAA